MGNVRTIIDQVARRLNELYPDDPEHWLRDELLVFLVDGLTELNLIAGEIQRTVTVTLNSTDNIYALPATVIAPMSCRVDGYYLQKQALTELDNELDWEQAGLNRNRPATWCGFGLTQILIHPRPLAAKTALVETLSMHPDLTNPDTATDLDIRPEYEPALEDFMLHRAMFKEGGAEFQQAQLFYVRFLDAVQFLSGLNVLRRYPAWDVAPETELSEVAGRESRETGGKA
jgi:hypothetical protein